MQPNAEPTKRDIWTRHAWLVRLRTLPKGLPLNLRTLRRRVVTTLVATTFYFALLIYPLIRLIDWLIPNWQPGTMELLALLVLPPAARVVSSRFSHIGCVISSPITAQRLLFDLLTTKPYKKI